jgi:hypothetical protein
VLACGVCRTDLHVVDGELPDPHVPIIPVTRSSAGSMRSVPASQASAVGERVGIPWLGHTCGVCPYCRMQRENLCDHPLFTGYTRDGGFATAAVADARFAFPLGEPASDVALAPLLCAGLIGWRSLAIAGEGQAAGPLRLRRRRAHPGAGRKMAGPIGVRLHPAGRRARRRSREASARPGPAAPTRCRPSRSTRRSSSQPWASWCRWRCRRCARAAGSCAPAST